MPASHARAEAAWNALNGSPLRSPGLADRHWVLGGGGVRIYHYDHFEPESSTLGRLSVFEIDPGRWALSRRLFAGRASFDGGELVLGDVWIRDFSGPAGPAFLRTPGGRLDAAGDRDAFFAPWREPLRMTYRDLRRYARDVRAMGFPAVRLRAELAQKVALPFVSLVMALLAVPFGLRAGRRGALVGVGLCVVLAMAYWGAFAVFRSLGAAGVLSPFLGAWGADLIFGSAGVAGLLKLRT